MNRSSYILFYSNQCKTCYLLVEMLKREDLFKYFNSLCVDDPQLVIPKNIDVVPTIIVPQCNKALSGNEIFHWIETMKFLRQQQHNQKITEYNANKSQEQKLGPHGYMSLEMDGFSDTFAYSNIDMAQPHKFYDYTNNSKDAIFTAPEQNKINKDIMDKRIKEIANKRKEQDENTTQIVKQQQIEAMTNFEERTLRRR